MSTQSEFKYYWNRIRQFSLPRWRHRIFFPHVPKCAGSSIVNALRNSFRDIEVQDIDLPASQQAARITGLDMMQHRQAVISYQMSRNRPMLVTGHCRCSPTMTQAFSPEWTFITVLREPIERWISEYVYNTYKSERIQWARNDLPIAQFVDTPKASLMGRMQVSFFGTPEQEDSELVKTALKNLASFSLVGQQANLPKFNSRLSALLDVSLPEVRVNSSPNSQEAQKIHDDPGIIRRIRELCAPDLELWDKINQNDL